MKKKYIAPQVEQHIVHNNSSMLTTSDLTGPMGAYLNNNDVEEIFIQLGESTGDINISFAD